MAKRARVPQNATEKPEDGRRAKAAVLLAEDRLTDEQIAETVGVDRTTLARWKRDATFSGHVRVLVGEIELRELSRGIARRSRRIAALNDQHDRMRQVIEARAIDLAGVPGGSTGLLVRQVKQVGQGRDAQMVEEYAVDTGLLRELREHAKQAAQELGQWSTNVTVHNAPLTEEMVREAARELGKDEEQMVALFRAKAKAIT